MEEARKQLFKIACPPEGRDGGVSHHASLGLFGVAHWRASHRLPPGLNRQESHSHRKGIHSKVMKMEDEVQE